MRLRCGFEPLWDRLLYIRYLSLVRPAVPYHMDPNWLRSAIYCGLNQSQEVIFTTDQQPVFPVSVDGKCILYYLFYRNRLISISV